MIKFNKILFPLLFLFISVTVLTFGFVHLDVFDGFNWFSGFLSSPTSSNYIDNTYTLNQLKAAYIKNSTVDSYKLPDNMYAVLFDMNKDISSDCTDSESIKNSVYSDFDYLRNFIPDTIFIVPDISGRFDSIKNSDGSIFDSLSYVISCCNYIGCDAVLVIRDELIYNNNTLSADKLSEYISSYGFSAVMMSPDKGYFDQSYYDRAKCIRDKIDTAHPDVFLGIEVHTDTDNEFLDSYTKKVLDEGLADFGYIDMNKAVSSEGISFATLAYYWNSVFDYYSIPCYCEHRLDLVFTNDTEWGYGTEINDQIEVLYGCSAFDGSCFNSVSSLKNKKTLARDLSIFVNDVSGYVQKSSSVQSLSINTNEVTFTGYADKNAYIYCNDSFVKNSEGHFICSDMLDIGYNSFEFFSNGSTYSYPIINVTDLFYSYSDITQAYDSKSKTINAFAVCPDGSVVYAVFNGSTYQMLPASAAQGVPQGYTAYTTSISLNNIKIASAELSLFCGYEDITQSKSCGRITDKKANVDSPVVKNDNAVFTPYEDNGLGNSLMCITSCDNTEQISERDDYDTYHPYNSSLLKGTIDYIDKINVSSEGYLRYELKSGINVYGTDCILINNGYNLPLNNAILKSFDDTAPDKTKLTFTLDWLSPITVTPEKIEYSTGYQGFSFNVENFDASYIDIAMYYTQNISVEQTISFAQNSLFSSYEINSDSETNKTVLRLYLRENGRFFGYDLSENDNGDIEISFKKRALNSISGKVIMLDAGHGGLSMVGTAVRDNSVSEAQVTLAIALKTKKYLEDLGATVIMTRTRDSSMSLSERTLLCETLNPDLFVSIHCDGSDSIYESGTHTFYYTPFSQPLADSIHNRLIKTYTESIYTVHDSNYSNVDRKIKYYPFYVTRVDNCPSVLIETGFLTNHTEGYVLINPVYQDKIALGISNGISDYFKNQY